MPTYSKILIVEATDNPEGGVTVNLWTPTLGLREHSFTGPNLLEVWPRVDAVIRTVLDTVRRDEDKEGG